MLPPPSGTPHHRTKRTVQHDLEDPHFLDSSSRTKHWVERQIELSRWGEEDSRPRDHVGSMWAAKRGDVNQRAQMKPKKEKRRLATSRHFMSSLPPPPGEPIQELLTSSYHGSPQVSRTSAFPVQQSSKKSGVHPSGASMRRRTSYATAIGDYGMPEAPDDIPVRESRIDRRVGSLDRHKLPRDFGDSRGLESSYTYGTSSHRHRMAPRRASASGEYGNEERVDSMIREHAEYSYRNHVSHYNESPPDPRGERLALHHSNSYAAPQVESYL